MVRTLVILQTGPLASPGVTQSACLWKQPVFLQWTVVSHKALCSGCRTASVFPSLKFWMLDFYDHNDLLVYTGNYKHGAILAYYSSLIYSIYFMLHQLQQPSYRAATRALARHRPPSRAQAPDTGSISIICSLHRGSRGPALSTATDCRGRGANPRRSSWVSTSGGAHRLRVVA